MNRNNIEDQPPPRRKGLLGRFIDWLERRSQGDWFDRLEVNSEASARGYHRVFTDDDPWPSTRSDPEHDLPHAELTEEERKRAIEEIRRRPRIG